MFVLAVSNKRAARAYGLDTPVRGGQLPDGHRDRERTTAQRAKGPLFSLAVPCPKQVLSKKAGAGGIEVFPVRTTAPKVTEEDGSTRRPTGRTGAGLTRR
jgi:hypothetical protein